MPGMPGESVKRSEDARFLSGEGRYVENIPVEGALHAVFVRSMMPHALIHDVDADAALAMTGVVGVFTSADVDIARQPVSGLVPDLLNRPVLASDVVRFAGEPIAVVVAGTDGFGRRFLRRIFLTEATHRRHPDEKQREHEFGHVLSSRRGFSTAAS